MARILHIGLGLLLLTCQGVLADPHHVVFLMSESGGAYQEVLEGAQRHLARLGNGASLVPVMAANLERDGPSSLGEHAMVVSVGVKATQVALGRAGHAPLLATLVPRASFERLRQGYKGGRTLSAIYLDQPAQRSMLLARLLQPAAPQLLALLGPDSLAWEGQLQEQAGRMGMPLNTGQARTPIELQPVLQRLLVPERGQVLLGIPDAQIYNAASLQTILLATYRHNVPFLGFSAAHVRAGAVAAVYSTPEQIGQQVADLIAHNVAARRWTLPPPQPPRYFSVGLNAQVARSLGLPGQTEAGLLDKLRKAEE